MNEFDKIEAFAMKFSSLLISYSIVIAVFLKS